MTFLIERGFNEFFLETWGLSDDFNRDLGEMLILNIILFCKIWQNFMCVEFKFVWILETCRMMRVSIRTSLSRKLRRSRRRCPLYFIGRLLVMPSDKSPKLWESFQTWALSHEKTSAAIQPLIDIKFQVYWLPQLEGAGSGSISPGLCDGRLASLIRFRSGSRIGVVVLLADLLPLMEEIPNNHLGDVNLGEY